MSEKMMENQNDMMDEYDGDSDRGGRRGGFARKKPCRFCTDSDLILDYKNLRMLQHYTSEQGKITPRRISGACAMHQRKLTSAVKRARNIALISTISNQVF